MTTTPPRALDVDERAELERLRVENAELQMDREFLKSGGLLRDREPEPVEAYQVMDTEGHLRGRRDGAAAGHVPVGLLRVVRAAGGRPDTTAAAPTAADRQDPAVPRRIRPRVRVAADPSRPARGKAKRELASVSPQHSLHAAEADAVALGQRTMRGASMSVAQQVADDLLAKAINQPPTTRCPRRCKCVAVVAVDLCGELADRRDQVLYLRVRETSS